MIEPDLDLRVGDILIVAFPLTSGVEAKTRPAVAVASEDWSSPDAILVVASISSSEARFADDGSVLVTDWEANGLDWPSVAQPHRLFSTQQRYVHKRLGRLNTEDRAAVTAAVQAFLSGAESRPNDKLKDAGQFPPGALQQTGIKSRTTNRGGAPDD